MLRAFAAIPGANVYVFMSILDVGIGHAHTRSQRTFLVYRFLYHERSWIMANQNMLHTP